MEKSEKHYKQLNAEERAAIMLMKRTGSGVREIGRFLKRSPSTFSNEIARDSGCKSGYMLPWLRTGTPFANQAP
jgi:transposase, IS30 family